MIVFNDQTSREIFAKTLAAMDKVEEPAREGWLSDGITFGDMVKREMLASEQETVLYASLRDTDVDSRVTSYFDFGRYYLDDDGNRKSERPNIVGGWANSGSSDAPRWGSHT